MGQLDFDYGTAVPIIIFIYHDPLIQSIHVSLYAAVLLSGIILENNLYNGTDWTSIQIICVTTWSAGITSSQNGPELSYGLTDHKGTMPSWGTKVCLAFPVLYVAPRRSPCPAPWVPTTLGPKTTRDVHTLTHTLHALFRLPCSWTFSVKPPQLHFILALANLPATAPQLGGWSLGCPSEQWLHRGVPSLLRGASSALRDPRCNSSRAIPLLFYLSHNQDFM